MTSLTHSEIKVLQAIRSIPVPTDGDTLIVPINIGKSMNGVLQDLTKQLGCDRTKLLRYLIVRGLLALLPTDSNDQQEQRDYVVEGHSE